MLLDEFDEARTAVIEPDMVHGPVPDFPETVVSVFSHRLFASVAEFLGKGNCRHQGCGWTLACV